MALNDDVLAITATILARPDRPLDGRLADALRTLCKWRAQQLAEDILADRPLVVDGGPFAGMRYLPAASEGSLLPKLFGCYEQELHPVIESLGDRGYARVLDVGCAEGYYAVGLARRLGLPVHAHDVSAEARALCAQLAQLNDVADRVHVGGAVTPDDLARLDERTLLLVDVEGAERELLDPEQAPALRDVDVLVEVHESFVPGIGAELERRFAATHDIERIASGDRRLELPPVLHGRASLDQLLAVWEWRLADPGWLWLTRARG